MALDADNLGPAVDLDTIDFATLDRGDKIEPDEVAGKPEEKPEEKPEDKSAEGEEKKSEVDEDEDKGEEKPLDEVDKANGAKPRNDKGQFEARIPKSRFDEAVGKEREAREAAERKAAELEQRLQQQAQQQTQQQTRNDALAQIDEKLTELEKSYTSLVLDGDQEKAAKVQAEMRQLNRQAARIESQEESSAVVEHRLESQRLDVAIARLEADHPILNPESEVYDRDVVQMVLLVQKEMVGNGAPPSTAMLEASKYVLNKLESMGGGKKPEVKEEGLGEAKEKVDDRKKQAVEKSLSTQKSQPSAMKDAGVDSDKHGEKGLPDVSKMTVEEFNALPESTRARMRGDLL